MARHQPKNIRAGEIPRFSIGEEYRAVGCLPLRVRPDRRAIRTGDQPGAELAERIPAPPPPQLLGQASWRSCRYNDPDKLFLKRFREPVRDVTMLDLPEFGVGRE
jgi:hypothetical protein